MVTKLKDAGAERTLRAARRAGESTVSIGTARKIAAELLDTRTTESSEVLPTLSHASRATLATLVADGMSRGESHDLAALLGGELSLTSGAREFLSTLASLEQPNLKIAGLEISSTGKAGILGTARPGDIIEGINLTTAPIGRIFTDETRKMGTAGADGSFTAALKDAKEGDIVRLRARHHNGKTTGWLTVKLQGHAAKDARQALVSLDRIGLTAGANDTVEVENINGSRQVSEPGARLQFRNVRTGEKTVVTLDENGTFKKGTRLTGKKGDTFAVAASDGTNNVNFSKELAQTVSVPGGPVGVVDLVEDPALYKTETRRGKPLFSLKRFSGPLFKNGCRPEDVQQGNLADCYFPASMAALALSHGKDIEKMISKNRDGTYTVTFQEVDRRTGKASPVPIVVDGDLYVRAWGGPLYGRSAEADKSQKSMELWFALIEKAWATWYGSYNAIGDGGVGDEVFESVLGIPGMAQTVRPGGEDAAWKTITTALDEHRPVAAPTYGEKYDRRYTNTGLYSDHTYSVLGYEEKGGQRLVKLRNPWGESEPSGNGKNDGVFLLPLEKFCQLFDSIWTTRSGD